MICWFMTFHNHKISTKSSSISLRIQTLEWLTKTLELPLCCLFFFVSLVRFFVCGGVGRYSYYHSSVSVTLYTCLWRLEINLVSFFCGRSYLTVSRLKSKGPNIEPWGTPISTHMFDCSIISSSCFFCPPLCYISVPFKNPMCVLWISDNSSKNINPVRHNAHGTGGHVRFYTQGTERKSVRERKWEN